MRTHFERASLPRQKEKFTAVFLSFFLPGSIKMSTSNPRDIAAAINTLSSDGLDLLGGADSHALAGLLADYFDSSDRQREC